jgi:hypothetical protein
MGSVTVDARALRAGLEVALRALAGDVEKIVVQGGEKGAELARTLAPKRTRALEESIHVTPLELGPRGPFVKVVAGTREAVPMEFGTYKDRPQPFMRPSAAALGGAIRAAGYAVRARSGGQMAARRLKARADVRRQRQSGTLTAAQARQASRSISQQLRTRRRRS